MTRLQVKDVFNLQMGKTPSRKSYEYWTDGTIDWVSIRDLGSYDRYVGPTKEKITQLAVDESGIRPAPPNTLIMSFKLSLGKVAITVCPTYTNEAIMAFIDKGRFPIDLDYMYHQFTAKDWTEGTNIAVMGATLNKKSLAESWISVPTMEEQREVARLLDTVVEKITEAQDFKNKLDELVKSRFVEMFGNPHEMDRWRVCDVSEIADVTVGVVVKPAQYYVAEGEGVRAFRSLNIAPMRVKNDSWVYFSKEGNEKNKKSQLHAGDVVLVRSGAPGVACVVTPEYEGCNAVDIIIARLNKEKVDPVFFAAFMNYPHGQVQITDGTGGSAQQHFNVGTCKKMRFALPPLSLQREFSAFVQQVDKLKFETQQAIEKLQLLYDSLAQEYFGS